jgi:hypothetical protein
MAIRFGRSKSRLYALVVAGSIGLLGGCKVPENENALNPNPNASDKVPGNNVAQAKSARDFVLLLQRALRSNDRGSILSVIGFPVRVGENDNRDDLDKSAFTRDYDKVWKPETINVVMNENPDHFTGDHDHFAIGCGEVWFDKTKDQQFRIAGFDISEYRIAGMSIQECHGVRNFLAQLQAALASDRREQVAAMLKYPLRYHGENKNMVLHSARDVISNYDLIFSAKLRRAVAEQKPWTLEGSSDGIGIEGGFIWMSDPSQNGSFKVTSIFAPP